MWWLVAIRRRARSSEIGRDAPCHDATVLRPYGFIYVFLLSALLVAFNVRCSPSSSFDTAFTKFHSNRKTYLQGRLTDHVQQSMHPSSSNSRRSNIHYRKRVSYCTSSQPEKIRRQPMHYRFFDAKACRAWADICVLPPGNRHVTHGNL